MDDGGVLDEQASSREALLQLRGEQIGDACAGDGNAEQEEAQEHGQLIRVAQSPQV
jgi:hypothetical protein